MTDPNASAPAVDGSEEPGALNAAGLVALAEGDCSAAATAFARAAAADPGAPALWMNLATARRRLNDAEGERAALNGALAADQRHFMAQLRLAELHERLGEHAPAAQRWGAVLALAAQMDPVPPGLDPVLEHARTFTADHAARFAEAIDGGLATARAALPPAALRRADACVAAATGRRRIYDNECSGVRFPFLPADEFFERAHFPWLAELEAATPAITAEYTALIAGGTPGFAPYVAMPPGTPANKWSPLDNKLDWGAWYLWRYGAEQAGVRERCPETMHALAAVPLADMPGRGPTAFFSVLKPGTRLPAHSGVSNVRAIVHLPLIVPPGCGFRVGGETREWHVGEAWVFDDTIEHEAWNDSAEPRAILILDVWNPHLTEAERAMMRAFFRTADASGYGAAASE